ncbi:MAG: hypothetical protein QNL97_05240 [Pseudomonadales bacterium]|jgi:hypothetical protein|tara:strand:+ start:2484 stop:2612 length:129 start_codon:yes stop_codon:yes gene_type:complete
MAADAQTERPLADYLETDLGARQSLSRKEVLVHWYCEEIPLA